MNKWVGMLMDRLNDFLEGNLPWLREFGSDIAAVVLSGLMVLGYYLLLRVRTRRDPHYSIIAVNALARRIWVHNVMTNQGKDVMAVQTLRNFIMVGTMMASTSSLLIIGPRCRAG